MWVGGSISKMGQGTFLKKWGGGRRYFLEKMGGGDFLEKMGGGIYFIYYCGEYFRCYVGIYGDSCDQMVYYKYNLVV